MKDKYLTIAKCLVNVMLFLGIPVTLSMPFFIKWYGNINSYYKVYYWPQTVIFLVNGIFACLIVYEIRKMLKTVEKDNCFVDENVHALRRMGTYSFIISVTSMVRLIIYITPGGFAVFLVFAIAGIFSKVLAMVFEKAVAYKKENDMTI